MHTLCGYTLPNVQSWVPQAPGWPCPVVSISCKREYTFEMITHCSQAFGRCVGVGRDHGCAYAHLTAAASVLAPMLPRFRQPRSLFAHAHIQSFWCMWMRARRASILGDLQESQYTGAALTVACCYGVTPPTDASLPLCLDASSASYFQGVTKETLNAYRHVYICCLLPRGDKGNT
eukprot:1150439-Pelagomonas_calceolata.AAC.1